MEDIKKWILAQQDNLDLITAQACHKFWENSKDRENFSYDFQQTHSESYELSLGRDLCYDRISTPLTYSLWYHPRRINTFLSFFIDKLINLTKQNIQVFDLGAGTGAVQWSILLVAKAMQVHGYNIPKIKIINIDTSPFMLYFNRDYLWQYFIDSYDLKDIDFQIDYEVNSWNNSKPEIYDTIIASSYLFDATDKALEIKNDFKKIVEKYNPSALLLLTSKSKKTYLDLLTKEFIELGYHIESEHSDNLLFNTHLNQINVLRNALSQFYREIKPLLRETSWTDPSYTGVIVSKTQRELNLNIPNPIEKISIYSPPIKVISEVKLNDNQIKASKYSNTPSVVIGPAGCGKSIVIAQKIYNTVRYHNFDKDLKILVTTFNKSLVIQLKEWLEELFGDEIASTNTEKLVTYFRFKNSSNSNVTLLHFDILPMRLGNVPYLKRVNEKLNDKKMAECIEIVKQENNINNDNYDKILNVDFLNEEYHRVIYGLEVGVKDGESLYATIRRVGRGNNPSLLKNSERRKLVFSCLKKYASLLCNNDITHYTIRRQRFLAELKKSKREDAYDYLFIDEFQDCTQADFKIFNLLLKNPDHFTIAGDLAQAVHIGKAARIPRFENMARRQFHRLEGSYRLPVRISEAIRPISKAIKLSFNNIDGVGVITPFKGSPPGARPIVVYGSTMEKIAEKIKDIFLTYKIYDLNSITILEKDNQLSKTLNHLDINSESDTILRLKGLEKRCVIWSTRAGIEYENEVYEFVYTILSRTSSILIIALYNDSLSIYKRVIGKLRMDRLIFWDEQTSIKFNSFRENINPEITIDEE